MGISGSICEEEGQDPSTVPRIDDFFLPIEKSASLLHDRPSHWLPSAEG